MVIGIASPVARAQPAPAGGLAWQAAPGCPDAASERARVERRLGHALDADDVSIQVAIAVRHGRYVARVALAPDDIRTLTSARCADLAEAVALIVARVAREHARSAAASIAVARSTGDAFVAPASPVPSPLSPPTIAPRVAAADDPETPDVEKPARPPRATSHTRTWHLGLRVSGLSGVGIVPRVGIGGEVAAAVHVRDAMIEVAAARWLASPASVQNGGDAHVDVALDVYAARVGWRSSHLPLRAWLSAETGVMAGAGVGLDESQVGSGHWLAIGAGFGVAWPITSWLRLVGSTEVLGALERVKFSLTDGVVVYEPSPLSARATLGLEVGW